MCSLSKPTTPIPVLVALALMCAEMGVAALGTVILLLPLAIVGSVPVLMFYVLGLVVALGVVVLRMRSRRPWVRWAGVAIQVVLGAVYVVWLFEEPTVGKICGIGLTATVIALLLNPASAAWFSGSSQPAGWPHSGPWRG